MNGLMRRLCALLLSCALACVLLPFPAAAAGGEGRILRVAFIQSPGMSTTDEDGTRRGLLVDYLDEIAKYTGWQYAFVDTTAERAYAEFLEGRFDLMGCAYYAEGYSEVFAFPDYSCGSFRSLLLSRWDDDSIHAGNLRELGGKVIGVYAGHTENVARLRAFLSLNGVEAEVRTYPDAADGGERLEDVLQRGEVDVILGRAGDSAIGLRILAQFVAQPHYLVTTPGNDEVLEGLNFALRNIQEANPNFAEEAFHANYPEVVSGSLDLTTEERAYIAQRQTVTVAFPASFHPLSCYETVDGGHQGITLDVLEAVAAYSGLSFVHRTADSYADALRMVQEGEADLLGFYLGSDDDALGQGLATTQPYTTLSGLIVRNRHVTYPSDGLRCVLLDGRVLPGGVTPGETLYYADVREALSAVDSGRADFIYGLSSMLERELQLRTYSNLVPVSNQTANFSICFALPVARDATLLNILNKAIHSLSTSERVAIASANLVSLGRSEVTLRDFFLSHPMFTIISLCVLGGVLIVLMALRARAMTRAAQVRAELARAEAASSAKSAFLSQMSHEIRTPLNGIVGMAHLGQRYAEEPARVRDCLDKIDMSSQHLLALINDVLDMSRIESGKVELSEEPFDFGELLHSLIADFVPVARERGILCSLELEGRLDDTLIGDGQRLRQIISNLLSNAIKFTDPGGEVTLAITLLREEEGHVWLSFEVRDTGCGIAQENLERIFRPFEQESAGIARKFGGSGLGLSITKNLTEMMGGAISVSSALGEGSTFRVILPFTPAHVELPWRGVGGGLRVLVISTSKRPSSVELLREGGFESDQCGSAEEAVPRIRAAFEEGRPYRLVLLNAQFCKGRETVEALRAASGEPFGLLLIGFDEDGLPEQARAIGADDALCLPAFRRDLLRVFDRLKDSVPKPVEDVPATPLRGLNILIVEDNAINREVALGLLELSGAHAETVCNGQEALARFTSSPEGYFDLVLMDMQMPVMDGLSATRAIRALPRSDARRVPIFAMTANALREDAERCFAAGMNAHISKPFTLEDVCEKYEAATHKA